MPIISTVRTKGTNIDSAESPVGNADGGPGGGSLVGINSLGPRAGDGQAQDFTVATNVKVYFC
jgi:hypothetical protein